MRLSCFLFVALLAVGPAHAADKEGPREHRAHQHGIARLEVAVDGNALQISLDGPADTFLGFEHAPRTDAQKQTVASVGQQLAQATRLFTPAANADCRAAPARVDIKLPSPGSPEIHSEIEAEWHWQCARPAALAHIDVGLFKAFPRLSELRTQIVTGAGQQTIVLKPGAARIKTAK